MFYAKKRPDERKIQCIRKADVPKLSTEARALSIWLNEGGHE